MTLSLILFVLTLLSSETSVNGNDAFFDVTKYGVRGDGRTDDTNAFVKVFGLACKGRYTSPLILIPSGRKYVMHAVDIRGPCNPKLMALRLDGFIVTRKGGNRKEAKLITFRDINNLMIFGVGGVVGSGPQGSNEDDGRVEKMSLLHNNLDDEDDIDIQENVGDQMMQTWFSNVSTTDDINDKPTNMAFSGCNHLRLNGISSSYSERNHFSISSCVDVIISNIKIKSPGNSKNTDGIDISRSKGVTVKDSIIQTGDDCIAINSGSMNIIVSKVHCGPGHGISIGSFKRGEAQVEHVDVLHCTFTDTTNGARIKSFADGLGGYVRWVTFKDITLQNVKRPIIIDQFYHEMMNDNNNNLLSIGTGGRTNNDTNQIDDNRGVDVSDVKFIGFKGTCSDDFAIVLNCRNGPGCNRITLSDVNIKGSKGQRVRAECHNAHGGAESVLPSVDCLKTMKSEKEDFIDEDE